MGLDWANKKFLGKPNSGKYGNEEGIVTVRVTLITKYILRTLVTYVSHTVNLVNLKEENETRKM